MSKTISIHVAHFKFPPTCVVCMSPSSKLFGVEQVYTYGNKSYTLKVNVPMCEKHYDAASFKSTAEKLVGSIFAVGGGILAGIAATIIMILRWQGDENIILKLFIGGIVGFGVLVMVWWIIYAFLAPLFAEREAKEARNAVKILLYSPGEQIARLEFANEQLAEILQKGN